MDIEMPDIGGETSEAKSHRVFTGLSRTANDILVTFIIGLAGLLTAWCGFQSDQWDERGTMSNIAALAMQERAGQLFMQTASRFVLDNNLFSQYEMARSFGKDDLAERIFVRLSPGFQQSLKSDPVSAPAELSHPESYPIPQRELAEQARKDAFGYLQSSRAERATADRYVMATVGLAFVLLLLAVGPKLERRGIRRSIDLFAVTAFAGLVVFIAFLPKTS